MKTMKKIYIIAAMAAVVTACSVDDVQPMPEGDSAIVVSAVMPDDGWVASTRAFSDGYSDLVLHYTNYKGEQASYSVPTENITADGNNVSFTTNSDLVWEMVKDFDGDETFYLTCTDSEGVTLFAETSVAHGAAAVAFGNMSMTKAKLTLNLTFTHNMEQTPSTYDFSASVQAKKAAGTYDVWTDKALWPVEGEAVATPVSFSSVGDDKYTYTYVTKGSVILPQQIIGETLTVTYGNRTYDDTSDDIVWTLDLSKIAVEGGVDGQMANQLIAGQNLTLNIKTGMINPGNPVIEVDAFVDGEDRTLTGEMNSGYVYDESTKTYTVYNLVGLQAWVDAYAQDKDLKVVVDFPTDQVDLRLPNMFLVDSNYGFVKSGDSIVWAGKTWAGYYVVNNYDETIGSVGYSGDILTVTMADESVHVVIDGMAGLQETETALSSHVEAVKEKVITFVDSGFTSLYVVGNLHPYYAEDNDGVSNTQTVVGEGIIFYVRDIGYTSEEIAVVLADVTSLPNRAFELCSIIKSFTFCNVIEAVGTDALKLHSSAQNHEDLILHPDQVNQEDMMPDSNSWAGYTWLSISYITFIN